MTEIPVVNVGVVSGKEISFVFNASYIHAETVSFLEGEYRAVFQHGKLLFNGKLYDELFFEPSLPEASFDLKAVSIGVNFHWEQQEDQRFRGALNLIIDGEKLIAINQVSVEDYLTSVISSEMSATASTALLKAHAVISRSWLLAQVEKNTAIISSEAAYQTCFRDEEQLIRWYDREDHLLFDVCADDHCQRYQGITRAYASAVQKAIEETRGEVLTDGETICDTRFSKCCGGMTERFETCWEPVHHSYLEGVRDSTDTLCPDLTEEAAAQHWIRTSPEAFCHTQDKYILGQVLNNYDQVTTDFYRWKEVYSQTNLANLIKRKSGIDFGQILDLIPVKRGVSGRLEQLTIVGSKRTFTIGKELEIRRTLSESHLYSAAFVVDKMGMDTNGVPQHFVLTGAGWGHGVGLCQIGAAIMGAQGYDYRAILKHYYPGTSIQQKY